MWRICNACKPFSTSLNVQPWLQSHNALAMFTFYYIDHSCLHSKSYIVHNYFAFLLIDWMNLVHFIIKMAY